jgi:hypothetical protein
MRYTYFVSYFYIYQNLNTGFGQSTVGLDYKIDSGDSLNRLTEFIKEQNGYANMVILNFVDMTKSDDHPYEVGFARGYEAGHRDGMTAAKDIKNLFEVMADSVEAQATDE